MDFVFFDTVLPGVDGADEQRLRLLMANGNGMLELGSTRAGAAPVRIRLSNQDLLELSLAMDNVRLATQTWDPNGSS